MSELKPVDCLPTITAEERQFLHYNPNTQDVVDWVVGYALASIEEWNRRAQPAAPAEPKGADGLPVSAPRLYADEEPPGHADHGSKARDLFDATPSVAPEPVAWEGGEGWESLAWELCADENGEDACNELIWEGGPIPEPWGDRWMKYEGEAKRLIALVHKHAAHPPRAPLTDEHPYTYTSTQATNCAGCGEYKHTPLRIDAMGGYVCLTCIDKKLGTVLGEFGYPAPQAPLTEEQIDAMWQAAYQELCDEPRCSFDWFEAGIRALEHAHGIGGK